MLLLAMEACHHEYCIGGFYFEVHNTAPYSCRIGVSVLTKNQSMALLACSRSLGEFHCGLYRCLQSCTCMYRHAIKYIVLVRALNFVEESSGTRGADLAAVST
eukprot:scpid99401/ scgid10735/ 